MAALQLCERPIVLFDFDGTVADTGRAVMTSTRKALAARGFSEAQMGDLRRMIGPPLWLFPRGVACGGRRVPCLF